MIDEKQLASDIAALKTALREAIDEVIRHNDSARHHTPEEKIHRWSELVGHRLEPGKTFKKYRA